MLVKTVAELSEIVGGQVVGCEAAEISNALPLQDAVAGCITLAEDGQPMQRINDSPAAAVLVNCRLENCNKPLLVVPEVHVAFQQLVTLFRPPLTDRRVGVDATARIHPSTQVGLDTYIGAGVTVGAECVIGKGCTIHAGVHIMPGCRLGDDCTVFPNVVLYPDTKVGNRVLIQAGVVLGALGFGYKVREGVHQRAAQLGWLEIGDDVDIGANTTIDRGTYGATKIGCGTKIDNLVQIGHNCHIGQHNLICSQVGIAGSSCTGDHVVLAGQVGLADHVRLGDRAVVGAQSGVMRDVEPDEVVFGSPAMARKTALQNFINQSKVPEIRRELRKLQEDLGTLQTAIEGRGEIENSLRDAA